MSNLEPYERRACERCKECFDFSTLYGNGLKVRHTFHPCSPAPELMTIRTHRDQAREHALTALERQKERASDSGKVFQKYDELIEACIDCDKKQPIIGSHYKGRSSK